MATEGDRPGRIITFYSYKGGTGRSMAVGNVAWILASNGNRVLVVDWDLEAPGLHKYFLPFLRDKQLSSTRGVLDFLLEFASAAMSHTPEANSGPEWFLPYANILRYAASLEWQGFPERGALDLVVAGRQDSQYATRVNSFDWQAFYDKLGGGVFLEAVKARMRSNYDYVLIDSRTGVSDTSGVCTVQMPDDLVVCFTYNSQSIEGASAVAEAVHAQRRRPDGSSSVRIWPVPMRVELAEKDKLEASRDFMRRQFGRVLGHLAERDQEGYWASIEVLYYPCYAYEEILAIFGDRQGQTHSMLSSMETITNYVTSGRVTQAGQPSAREEVVKLYARRRGDRQTGSSDNAEGLSNRRKQPESQPPSSDNIEKVVLERLEDQIVWYDRKSTSNQRIYKQMKIAEIAAAATIPVVVAFRPSPLGYMIAGLALLVTILEGLLQLNQYQQNWTAYRATCEALKHEKYMYLSKSGPYLGTGNSVALLAERLEGLVATEYTKWSTVKA